MGPGGGSLIVVEDSTERDSTPLDVDKIIFQKDNDTFYKVSQPSGPESVTFVDDLNDTDAVKFTDSGNKMYRFLADLGYGYGYESLTLELGTLSTPYDPSTFTLTATL